MLIEVSLFLSAFLSATILPGSSEAALLLALTQSTINPLWLIFIATIGNTLGATTSWAFGKYLPQRLSRKPASVRFPKWSNLFQSYGKWSLLLTWVPIIGDAIPIAAGLSGMTFLSFAPLVFLGKALRYFVVAGLFQHFLQL